MRTKHPTEWLQEIGAVIAAFWFIGIPLTAALVFRHTESIFMALLAIVAYILLAWVLVMMGPRDTASSSSSYSGSYDSGSRRSRVSRERERSGREKRQSSGGSSVFIGTKTCPDCDGGGGSGKCSQCHGTGFEEELPGEALLRGWTLKCRLCGGDTACHTCYGKGYLRT